MNELVFVGLGLNDEKGVSVNGLEETKTADYVFMELYTSFMPDFNLQNFEVLCGKQVRAVSRRELEEEGGEAVLASAEKGKTVFLVPGDPFIATTHVTLRIDAEKRGVKTRIVHGASIISAIVSLSGLHNYKFGKTVTVPFPENFSETPYDVIAQNKNFGLHTLCLLDLKADERQFLSINQAIALLREVEKKKKMNIVTMDTAAVGVARAGSKKPTLKADFIRNLEVFDFGKPPYSLIFPGDMHFMEVEALIALADAPSDFRRFVR
ncbi:MAG TPA: diphthine synthase [Candidatus Limnocylindrales bacterium]|nr:diphthine synthase [Candidatus Limnocylindrales bacterium]